MKELFRVLRPGGVLFVQVPVAMDGRSTDEDPAVVDPKERSRRFGQSDHVRVYGLDLADRLAEAGFRVAPLSSRSLWSDDVVRRYGLTPRGGEDVLFVCRKSSR